MRHAGCNYSEIVDEWLHSNRTTLHVEIALDCKNLPFHRIEDRKDYFKKIKNGALKSYPKCNGSLIRLERTFTGKPDEFLKFFNEKSPEMIIHMMQNMNKSGDYLSKAFIVLIDRKIEQGFLDKTEISDFFNFEWNNKNIRNRSREVKQSLTVLLNKCSYYDLPTDKQLFLQKRIHNLPRGII